MSLIGLLFIDNVLSLTVGVGKLDGEVLNILEEGIVHPRVPVISTGLPVPHILTLVSLSRSSVIRSCEWAKRLKLSINSNMKYFSIVN